MQDLRARADAALAEFDRQADAMAEFINKHPGAVIAGGLFDSTMKAACDLHEVLSDLIEAADGWHPPQ
jgi:hypothetical protein